MTDRHLTAVGTYSDEEYALTDSNEVKPIDGAWIDNSISMRSGNPDLDFIHGDGLLQSFTASNDPQNDVFVSGRLHRWQSPIAYWVDYVVDRMTVKTVCRE